MPARAGKAIEKYSSNRMASDEVDVSLAVFLGRRHAVEGEYTALHPGGAKPASRIEIPRHARRRQGGSIHQRQARRIHPVHLEPKFASQGSDLRQTLPHTRPMNEAAVADYRQGDISRQPKGGKLLSYHAHRFGKFGGGSGLAIAGKSHIADGQGIDAMAAKKHPLPKLAENPAQLLPKESKVKGRRPSAHQTGHLAIDTAPIAGVVGVKVDTDGYPPRPAGKDRVDIAQAKACPIMILMG